MKRKIKVVILAGGLGSRLEEETVITPKPMVTIGRYPILVHIMKIYSTFGFNDFIICLGYKGHLVKEYFANYFLHNSDITFDFSTGKNRMIIHSKKVQPWRVTLVDTGLNTGTGGRIKRIQPYVGKQTFMLTYGDGVADINIKKLLRFHFAHGKIATVTAVKPPGKFGVLSLIKSTRVHLFSEKPAGDGGWISGGFFVLNHQAFDYIQDNQTAWEATPLKTLSREGQLMAYLHHGFWKCMDTLRDKRELESLWNSKNPPWKIWP